MDENVANTPQDAGANTEASGIQTSEQHQVTDTGENTASQQPQGEQNTQSEATTPEDGSIYSEKNSFKMVVDPRTGKRRVVINNVQTENDAENTASSTESNQGGTQTPAPETEDEVGAASDSGTATEQQTDSPPAADTSGLVSGLVGTENTGQSKEYTPQELSLALQLGQVDENRIPVSMRQQYYNYKTQQGNPETGSVPTNQAETATDSNDDIASYYGKIDTIAKQLALKDLGLTQEELETAEYSDDKALTKKVELYKVAVESNRNKIILDIERERGKSQSQQEEFSRTFNEVKSFVEKVQQEEPNFMEIDKLMATRAMELPYAQASAIVPVLQRLAQHKTTREDIPVLQKYYDDTRVEFYSRLNNVKRAPEIIKPPVVEQPGTGKELPAQKPDVSQLGNLPYKDKIKAIGQLFRK